MQKKNDERQHVLDLLHAHQPKIKQLGVRSLALFGSLARNEARPESDVDLLVDLEPPYTYDRYIQVKFFFEDLLGRSVDLVLNETLKPHVKEQVLQEAIRVA